jgi:hypothetical protein
MKLATKTIKRGNSYKTEYRLDDVYIDYYCRVDGLIEQLNAVVDMFPEELRPDVLIDMDYDSHYATFAAEGPASKEEIVKAKAKEKRDKERWLATAVAKRAELDAQIAIVSKGL